MQSILSDSKENNVNHSAPSLTDTRNPLGFRRRRRRISPVKHIWGLNIAQDSDESDKKITDVEPDSKIEGTNLFNSPGQSEINPCEISESPLNLNLNVKETDLSFDVPLNLSSKRKDCDPNSSDDLTSSKDKSKDIKNPVFTLKHDTCSPGHSLHDSFLKLSTCNVPNSDHYFQTIPTYQKPIGKEHIPTCDERNVRSTKTPTKKLGLQDNTHLLNEAVQNNINKNLDQKNLCNSKSKPNTFSFEKENIDPKSKKTLVFDFNDCLKELEPRKDNDIQVDCLENDSDIFNYVNLLKLGQEKVKIINDCSDERYVKKSDVLHLGEKCSNKKPMTQFKVESKLDDANKFENERLNQPFSQNHKVERSQPNNYSMNVIQNGQNVMKLESERNNPSQASNTLHNRQNTFLVNDKNTEYNNNRKGLNFIPVCVKDPRSSMRENSHQVQKFEIPPIKEESNEVLAPSSRNNGNDYPSIAKQNSISDGVIPAVCSTKREKSYIAAAKPKSNVSSINLQSNDGFAVPAPPPGFSTSRSHHKNTDLVVNGKTYQVLKRLGKGGSSEVYLVLTLDHSELYAVKCVKLHEIEESMKNDYLNEIQHLVRMQTSGHVVKLLDHQYVKKEQLLFVVMERGDTDLAQYLKNLKSSPTPEAILHFWADMLLAVKSMHDNNIIHRDLKPANFLLIQGRLKLIDFGIASSIQSEQTSIFKDSYTGTFNYMSPEAVQDLGNGGQTIVKIGRKTDVWSLGCILYNFLYGKTPFQDIKNTYAKLHAIANASHVIPFPELPRIPDVLIESCKRCLVHNPKERASVEELLEMREAFLYGRFKKSSS